MKNILIPTDFSENSWNAIRYALELYRGEICTFHILNTYTPVIPSNRFMASSIQPGLLESGGMENSKKGLSDTLKRIKRNYKNTLHEFKTISSFSLLVDEIKDTIEKEAIDLLIMGTKGASGVEGVFMGSNAVRIIKAIRNCPVLTIPKNFEYVLPKEIVFATDFKRYYSVSELAPLMELAKSFKATIRIVYVQNEIKALTEIQQFNLNMLRKYFNKLEFYVHTVSERSSVSNTLEVFADELEIHLLAMLNYQHSYMERITREPVVKRMAFHTHVPLLVIPELGMNAPSHVKIEHGVLLEK
jgi:nucleotide-binding universal stress UspA family protein